jgi:Ca-activated chloride channel family protein
MFRFAEITALLMLLLVPGIGLMHWLASRSRTRALEQFGDSPLVQKLSASVNFRGRTWKTGLVLTSTALMAFALARPQFGTRVETVKTQGRDILVALDVSKSMLAEDLAPNRLERAKLEIGRLVRGLDGDRIGLVAFAGDAFVQAPLTADYGAALLFLNSMDTDLLSVQGTDLGLALTTALDAFDEGASRDQRVLVVVTDGEDHEGEIEAAVQRAQRAGVQIHTVGVGSPEGEPIPEFDENGRRTGFMRDDSGNVVTTRLEEGVLRQIAEATDGRYVPAYSGTTALQGLVDEIAGGEGGELESRQVTQYEEQFQIFLGLAILMLLLETLIPDRKRRTEAWTGRF